MSEAYVMFNGVKSTDLSLRIARDVQHSVAQVDMEQVTIMGRHGVALIDNSRLKEVRQAIPFVVKPKSNQTVFEIAQKVSQWLSARQYVPLEFSWDSDYVYRAIVVEDFKIEEIVRIFGRCSVEFLLHPIKHLKTGQERLPLRSGQALLNPLPRASSPLWRIEGTGNVTLAIGTQTLVLKNVTGGIVIDSETKQVYWNHQSQYDKMFSGFPVLPQGETRITWDNASFRVSVVPRWEAKI